MQYASHLQREGSSGTTPTALAPIACVFSGCNREWRQTYKAGVIGDRGEVHGTRETLHFNADGSLNMDNPSEHHTCTYEFPDSKHIRLDCVAPQTPHHRKPTALHSLPTR